MRYFFVFIFIVFAQHSFANNLSGFKSTCAELGFKKGTEKFGECVLKLRDKFNNQSNISQIQLYVFRKQRFTFNFSSSKEKNILGRLDGYLRSGSLLSYCSN